MKKLLTPRDAILHRSIAVLQLSLLLILLFSAQGKTQLCSKPTIVSDVAVDGVINGSTISSAVIHCAHDNALQYYWLLNGSMYSVSQQTIVLSDLPGGHIQCHYNDCAELSDSITIITPPVFNAPSLVNITTSVGGNFTLLCKSSGYPYPVITWFHNDKAVGYGSQFYVDIATESDTGMYTCLASNDAGYRTSAVWVVVVSNVVSSSMLSVDFPSSSNIPTTSSLSLDTIPITTPTYSPSTSTLANKDTPTDSHSLIIILSIVVPGFSLIMLILIGVCYWLMELKTKGSNNKDEDDVLEDTERQTIKTSTSYVNASFKDEELFNDEDDDDDNEDMIVKLLTSNDNNGYKAVFAAHAYKSDTANLFDSSKPGVKPNKKIAVSNIEVADNPAHQSTTTSDKEEEESISMERMVATKEYQECNRSSRTASSTNTEGSRQSVDELADQLLSEEVNSLQDDFEPRYNELVDDRESLESETLQQQQQQQEGNTQDKEDNQEETPPLATVHIPKWLTENRSDNRSDPLSGLQLINLVRKLDLMSAREARNHPLSEQFKSVPFNLTSPHSWPPDTMSKNRYRDVVPYPQTAVTLSSTGEPISTYINANYIKGFDGKERTYISSQGPLYDTVPDFWRMIWENEVEAIVMVTALYEGGKNKCAKYWPSSGESDTQSYGDFIVRNVHEEAYENYKITFLCVSLMNDPGAVRDVYHFSFLGWPDFGAPNEGYAMLQLWRAVESIKNPKQTLLVHCSAGIGRSGTYIAIDIGIHQYEQDNVVDPLLILSLLRQDRGGMIQTLEQYEYLHRVLSCYVVQNLK